MASSQSFSRIQRRISLSPEPQSPLESGEPLKMMAMRLPPFSGGLHLGQHGLQEQQRAVVHARHAGLVAGLLQFPGFLLVAVLAAPGDAEGRIAEHEVEAEFGFGKLVARLFAVRLVGDERVAEKDLGLLVVLDEQVGLTDGVVGRGKLLPVDGDELLDACLALPVWRRGRAGVPWPRTTCRRCRRRGRRWRSAGRGWESPATRP